ncbi:MAG: rod shape-determining protein RodA [Candidatus Latescibacterota bacterium]|nr:MAG: rod shape-determining protein RodA [Candidatus Latescibacterota bacterium]
MSKRDIEWGVLLPVVALLILGVLGVYSATRQVEALRYFPLRQALFGGIGLGIMLLVCFIPPRVLYSLAYPLYAVSLVSLVALLVCGTPLRGTVRWFSVGSFHLQPSEPAKFSLILALARFLENRRIDLRKARWIAPPFLIAALYSFLVVLEPDLGTALSLGFILLPMLWWAGMPPVHLFLLMSPALNGICALLWVLTGNALAWGTFVVILTAVLLVYRPRFAYTAFWIALHIGIGTAVPSLWERLHDYQQRRVVAFLNPGSDPTGAGYQILQSKVAIGSGGLWGKGFLKGTQTGLAFVPARHTDFILAVIGEELGLFGITLILAFFGVLIWRSITLAGLVRSRFLSLCTVGAASIWAFQTAVNVGMTLGLMPVTGLPLPFLSYGGSSLLAHLALVGLVLNAGVHRYEY